MMNATTFNYKKIRSTDNRPLKKTILTVLPYLICFMLIAIMLVMNSHHAFAAAQVGTVSSAGQAATSAMDAVFGVIRLIMTVVGVLLLLVGLIKFIIAHANEDGPNQQKAAMMMAAGLALLVFAFVINQLGIDERFFNTSVVSTRKG